MKLKWNQILNIESPKAFWEVTRISPDDDRFIEGFPIRFYYVPNEDYDLDVVEMYISEEQLDDLIKFTETLKRLRR